MKNRPLYHKLYADMIREKYPEKEASCSSYLKKENWTALDVIQVNTILFAEQHKQMEIASDQKHRAYDIESVRQILRYQQINGLNNKQLADKFCLSRNTVAKWRRLVAEEAAISAI